MCNHTANYNFFPIFEVSNLYTTAMKTALSTEENYNLLTLENPEKAENWNFQSLQDTLIKVTEENKNPCIIIFKNSVPASDTFFERLKEMSDVFFNCGLQWVLIPPFEGSFDALEASGVQYAPTFSEAVDMAFMIKLEQELNGDDENTED